VQVDTKAIAADIGKIDGNWSVVVVKKTGAKHVWSFISLNNAIVTKELGVISGSKIPVVGCYLDDMYALATFNQVKNSVALTNYSSGETQSASTPSNTLSVRCGTPQNGTSAFFYLKESPARKTRNVVAKYQGKTVLSSPRLDTKLTNVTFGVVPRGEGRIPTAMVTGKIDSKQVVQLLDSTNKWRTIPVPSLAVGDTISGAVGIRHGSSSFILIQVTNKARATSYIRVPIAEQLL
jgi:hypothetical protein